MRQPLFLAIVLAARRHLVSIICLAVAATIGLAAIADHRNK
jgi:hypothetical protein